MNMNASQARVVDPILTTHVRGYRHQDRVGHFLFPSVEVTVAAGKVIEFGKESFMLYNARRAPGAATKRIEFGYEGKPFTLVQDSLESKVPREFARDAAAVPGVDLGMRATNTVMNSLTLTLEYDQATIATTAGNYSADNQMALKSSSKWSHSDSNPVSDINSARQRIRNSCGVYPNTLVLGPKPYAALKNNVKIRDHFRNVDLITSKLLSDLLEIEQIFEGRSLTANDEGKFQDVWGNNAVLAYAPRNPGGFEEPSYGYTYTMKGNPFVEEPYWENPVKSWIYGVTYERAPVLAGMDAVILSKTSREVNERGSYSLLSCRKAYNEQRRDDVVFAERS